MSQLNTSEVELDRELGELEEAIQKVLDRRYAQMSKKSSMPRTYSSCVSNECDLNSRELNDAITCIVACMEFLRYA